MPVERAAEFARRLVDLGDEFAAAGDREGLAIGFAGAVYAIDLPEEP
jgi:hypothetical protein